MSYQYFTSRLANKNSIDYVIDKEKSIKAYKTYMLVRLQKMFKYENLPDSIPREMLEFYLLTSGTCIIAKDKNNLYALIGTVGGEPDIYYRPTKYIVGNPRLENGSKEYTIGENCVLMRNDSMWYGLDPLMSRYASLLAENVLTIRVADIMLRAIALLTAPDDSTKIACDEYLKNLESGKLGSVAENRFFDGINMQSPPSNNGSYLTQFIELQQYIKGSFYNEIGLNANFNMKREAIGEGESSLNEDSLLPLCEDMLQCRKEDIDKVNKMFGTNISVDFDSAWLENAKAIQYQLEKQKNEASQLAGGDRNANGENSTGDNQVEQTNIGDSSTEDKKDELGQTIEKEEFGSCGSTERTDSESDTSLDNESRGDTRDDLGKDGEVEDEND